MRMVAVAVSLVLFPYETTNSHADVEWVPGFDSANAPMSCRDACRAKAMRPVTTERPWSNSKAPGTQYYVCAYSENDEGVRPGYNLDYAEPGPLGAGGAFNRSCRVGWNGQEIGTSIGFGPGYACLCLKN
jgi:hypothetical protein